MSFVLDLDNRQMQLGGFIQSGRRIPFLYIGQPSTILMNRPDGTGWAFNVPPLIAVYRH